MPPKTELITVGDDPEGKKKLYIPQHPLTTKGKIIKAERQREKAMKNQPREAPTPKLRSLPPPGEMEEEEASVAKMRAERRAATRSGRSKFNSIKTPLTTQAKMSRAQSIRRANGEGGGRKTPAKQPQSLLEMVGGLSFARRNAAALRPPLTKTLKQQDPVVMSGSLVKLHSGGVLMRATKRALRLRQHFHAKYGFDAIVGRVRKTGHVIGEVNAKDKQRNDDKCWLLGLPDEVRPRIWRHSVVDTRFPVWVTDPEGCEQPDLALTCLEIRNEVLPIYYAENVFALNISPEVTAQPAIRKTIINNSKDRPLKGLGAAHKMATVLQDADNEGGQWFGMIKHWAMSYHLEDGSSEEEAGFFVSIRFEKTAAHSTWLDNATPKLEMRVEVHREAACVMPWWPDYGTCELQQMPIGLSITLEENLSRNRLSADSLLQVAKTMREMVAAVEKRKCTAGGHEARVTVPVGRSLPSEVE